MEQATVKISKRAGWSDREDALLWETADEFEKHGWPLKSVFERIAGETGRRPNSIRNYYYAQVRRREGSSAHTQRFIPFTQEEVDWLIEQVLTARTQGQSVRSCLQKLSGGDHSLMLRYQNKYRSVIKSRPEYVEEIVQKLNGEGIACEKPEVAHRSHTSVQTAAEDMLLTARFVGDPEIVRACETIKSVILGSEQSRMRMISASQELISDIKDYLILSRADQIARLDDFIADLTRTVGSFEASLPSDSCVVVH